MAEEQRRDRHGERERERGSPLLSEKKKKKKKKGKTMSAALRVPPPTPLCWLHRSIFLTDTHGFCTGGEERRERALPPPPPPLLRPRRAPLPPPARYYYYYYIHTATFARGREKALEWSEEGEGKGVGWKRLDRGDGGKWEEEEDVPKHGSEEIRGSPPFRRRKKRHFAGLDLCIICYRKLSLQRRRSFSLLLPSTT